MMSESLRQNSVIATKIYNSMFLNRIQPEIEKIHRQIRTTFREIDPYKKILTINRIIEGVHKKIQR